MALFTYKAKKTDGTEYSSTREAADKFALFRDLKKEGDTILSFSEGDGSSLAHNLGKFSFSFSKSFKMADLIIFARNLSSMISAGLSLTRALTVLERQARTPAIKKTVAKLSEEISRGVPLSEAMKAEPAVFSNLFVYMVRAGEEGGNLAESLRIVSVQLEQTYNLQRKVKGAMMYPGIIVTVMVIIGILMMIFIVPTLTATFAQFNTELPMSTQFIIFISDTLTNHLILVLLGIAAFIVALIFGKKIPAVKRAGDFVATRMPIVGVLVQETNAARTARTMASLLSSGVDLVNAVAITADVLQNSFYKEILVKAKSSIEKGNTVSSIFVGQEKWYPVFVGEMIAVGEETGRLPAMLLQVAEFYEAEVDQKTKDMSTIIEPFLMVFIGLVVGFFAFSMIKPIYSLSNTIS